MRSLDPRQYVRFIKRPRSKQTIETISAPLGPEYSHWTKRRDRNINFLETLNLDWSRGFLDIGEENQMGKAIAHHFNCNIAFTYGDLDSTFIIDDKTNNDFDCYSIVTCLDVLEHLLNPLHFLTYLEQYIYDDAKIIISYPHSNSLFWNQKHWHEFYPNEFKYLLKRSGYEAIQEEKIKINYVVTQYFWVIQLTRWRNAENNSRICL
jgi:hypothetical protein